MTRRAVLTGLLASLLVGPAGAAINQPFGAHTFSYAPGSIRPDHVSQSVQDQAVRDFYDAWKGQYLKQGCGAGRYYVATSTQPGNLTVSEGHGYGMVLSLCGSRVRRSFRSHGRRSIRWCTGCGSSSTRSADQVVSM